MTDTTPPRRNARYALASMKARLELAGAYQEFAMTSHARSQFRHLYNQALADDRYSDDIKLDAGRYMLQVEIRDVELTATDKTRAPRVDTLITKFADLWAQAQKHSGRRSAEHFAGNFAYLLSLSADERQLEDAHQIYDRVFHARKQKVGNGALVTHISRLDVARTRYLRGERDAADAVFDDEITCRARDFSHVPTFVLVARRQRAVAWLTAGGAIDDALRELRHVAREYQKLIGHDAPEVLLAMYETTLAANRHQRADLAFWAAILALRTDAVVQCTNWDELRRIATQSATHVAGRDEENEVAQFLDQLAVRRAGKPDAV